MTTSKKKQKNPRKLLDLDIREVSLVDRPAIRRKFLVIKRDEDGDNMSDQALSSEPQETFIFDEVVCKDEDLEKPKDKAEDESEEEEEEEEEEDESKEATAEADDKAKGQEDKKDKLEGASKDEDDDDEEDEDDDDEESSKNKTKKEIMKMAKSSIPVSFSKRADGSYDLTGVPKEMKATVEQICKQHEEAVQKALELEEILKAERDERLRRDYVEKAEKEFARLPGTSAEIGILLKSLNDLDKGVAEKVEGIFKAVNAQLENGTMLQEVGSASSDVETTAWGRIEKQAAEMMTTGEVSKAAAISKVLELNPKLYQDYLKEGGN